MIKLSISILIVLIGEVTVFTNICRADNSKYNHMAIASKQSAKQANQIDSKQLAIDSHLKKSIAFEDRREFSRAITEVTKAIKLKPNSIYLYCRRGDLFDQLEKYSRGLRDYKKALHIVPISGSDNYYRALALKNLGKYSQAQKYCDIAIKLGYTNQRVYKLKGKCYYRLKQYKKAIVYIKKAVQVEPTVTSYIYLSRCYRRVSDYKSAEDILVKAKTLEPNSTIVLLESAITKYRLKKLNESKKLYLSWRKRITSSALTYPNWKSFQYFCETEKKIDYYSEVIALSTNKNAAPIYERALLYLTLASYETTANEMYKYLKMTKWNGKGGIMAACYAIICYRLCGKQTDAARLTKIASKNFNYKKWPMPIFLFLESKLTKEQMLKAAVTKQKKTVAYYFISLSQLLKNKTQDAIINLQWIKKNGDPGVDEYNQAIAELDRLNRRKALHKR